MGEKAGYLGILFSLAVAAAFALNPFALPAAQSTVLWIMVFCGAMWFTEALPLHVTALLAPLLLVVFAGIGTTEAFAPFFDPVVVLLLGGFIMAVAMHKHGLDEKIAYAFINTVGHTPARFLLGIMLVAAFLSMWMTNTATTALLIPIAIVVLKANRMHPLKSSYAKSVVLGIAYAATIGGMGTLIGSTPNVIVAKFLGDHGITLSFVDWMYYALPLVVILIPIAWLLLQLVFPSEKKDLKVKKMSTKLNSKHKGVLAIFALTVGLWLTTQIHGYSSSLVAVVPIILLYLFGLLNTEDFSKAHWPALMLFGGGLALGSAIIASGLDLTMATAMNSVVLGQPLWIIFALIIFFSILLTLVASNTAAASVLVPVAIPLAAGLGVDLKIIALLAALGVSLDFVVPVGTPPSTIAYASGYIHVRDMAKAGIILALISIGLLTALALAYWV